MKDVILLLVLLAGAVAACSPSALMNEEVGQIAPVPESGEYVDILPQELQAMLENEDLFLVNVHVPFEGDIPGTDASVPFDQIADRLEDFPGAMDAKIVVYCRSGGMSAIAAQALVEAGFTNVYNLDGGFRAWGAAGYELIP